MVVIALQAEDDGASGRAIEKSLHGFPKGGQIGVWHAAPGDLDAGDSLFAHHFIENQKHLGVDNTADQQLAQHPASRKEVDEVVEQLLRFFIGGAIDDPFRVENCQQYSATDLIREFLSNGSG